MRECQRRRVTKCYLWKPLLKMYTLPAIDSTEGLLQRHAHMIHLLSQVLKPCHERTITTCRDERCTLFGTYGCQERTFCGFTSKYACEATGYCVFNRSKYMHVLLCFDKALNKKSKQSSFLYRSAIRRRHCICK